MEERAMMPMWGWIIGSYGVCVGFGRWNRLGWAFASGSGAIRLGPLGLLWARATERTDGETTTVSAPPETVPASDSGSTSITTLASRETIPGAG